MIPWPCTLAVLVAGKKASGILGSIPAEPRIDSRGCDPGAAWGEKKTDLPTSSKWQIGLLLWLKVARRETERSAASAKRAATTHRGIPKGAALGAPLVTFPATGKSPGVEGRSALPMGAVWGAYAPHLWSRNCPSAQKSFLLLLPFLFGKDFSLQQRKGRLTDGEFCVKLKKKKCVRVKEGGRFDGTDPGRN